MNPNQSFDEGQEEYDIAATGQSSDLDSSGADDDAYKAKCDFEACSPMPSMLEGRHEGNDLHAPCEEISTDALTRHYYIDVQN